MLVGGKNGEKAHPEVPRGEKEEKVPGGTWGKKKKQKGFSSRELNTNTKKREIMYSSKSIVKGGGEREPGDRETLGANGRTQR